MSPSVLIKASNNAKGVPIRPFTQLMRPGLIESRVTESPEAFSRLGEGFKRLFVDSSQASSHAAMAFGHAYDGSKPPLLGCGSPKPIVIPISGYTGHRKGEASENLFGKCFREVTIKSKIIERGGLQRHRNPFFIQRTNVTRNGSQTAMNVNNNQGASLNETIS